MMILQMKLKDHMDSKQSHFLFQTKNIKTDKLQVVVKSYTLIEKASPDILYHTGSFHFGEPHDFLLPNFNQYDRVLSLNS